MARALTRLEIELLLHCERSGWLLSDSHLEQHAFSSLITQGLLIQDGDYCHITVAGYAASEQVRSGPRPDAPDALHA